MDGSYHSVVRDWLRSPLGNALGHIGIGLAIMFVVGVLTQSMFVGWLAQAFYFLGRERRDHELVAGLDPFTEFHKGWNVLRWNRDTRRDLLAPVLANGAIAALVSWWINF